MSREIKFRTWYTYRNSFYIYSAEALRMLIKKPHGADVVAEQYTGLKDNNKVEIYEGDIVEVFDGSYPDYLYLNRLEVKYTQGSFYFDKAQSVTFEDVLDGDELDATVIGNIHENPELLGE